MTASKDEVEGILFAASAGDPAIRLQNLERDVDLVRISIKRILMDIRERMNEMENPFTIVASSGGAAGAGAPADGTSDVEEAKKSAIEAREAALDARESEMDATQSKIEAEKSKEEAEKKKKEAAA